MSGYTIISLDRAQVDVSLPVTIGGDNTFIYGIDFIHSAGIYSPTLSSSTSSLGRPPANITIQNCTFYGQNIQQSAIIGNYASLALLDNRFYDYQSSSDSIVSLESDCGMLFMENNTFVDVKYSAVTAIQYDILTLHANKFKNCGSMATAMMPYCVYVQSCYNTTTRITFTNNKHFADGYTYTPGQKRVAAYWIDGLPFSRQSAKINLDFNAAKGLDIGMRITNADDRSTGIAGGTRDTVAYVSVISKNQDVTGEWHYVVWGYPSQDYLIDADPAGTIAYYCDNDCAGGQGAASLVIFCFSLFGLFLLYSLFIFCFQCRSLRYMHVGYSNALGREIYTSDSVMPG